MQKDISIKLKATLLLIVFSMNTVVGFACAMGVDMGYNNSHHEAEATEVAVHVHADGKKHHHDKKPVANHLDKKDASKKDDCCNDKVIKFQNLDKSLSQNPNVAINAPVFVAILSSFFGLDIFKPAQVIPEKYFEFFHPPPPDILIVIQRFQI